jgi:hypothetical protein
VVKNVTRQTWSYEYLGGTYDAMWRYSCGGKPAFPYDWGFTETVVNHNADNTVTMSVTRPSSWDEVQHDFRGNYTQSGHMGQIVADLAAPDAGSITIFNIENTATGFTSRLTGTMSTRYEWRGGVVIGAPCQITDGRIVAVRRP